MSGNFMDPLTYKALYPIFYFDVSKQSERFRQSVVDVTINMRFGGSGIPKKVVAHAWIISDRRMIFKSDGSKMNIKDYTESWSIILYLQTMEEETKFTQLLVDSTKPGDVEYITISGTSSRLFTRFTPPIVLDPTANSGYEIALCRLETFYTFPNINEKNNALRVSVDWGQYWIDLKIPAGCYNITGINETIAGQS